MSPKYLTDGARLYEIAAQRTVRNYGLAGGTISYTLLIDAADPDTPAWRVDDLTLAALSEVRQAA